MKIHRTVLGHLKELGLEYLAVRHHDYQIRRDCPHFLDKIEATGFFRLKDSQIMLPGKPLYG